METKRSAYLSWLVIVVFVSGFLALTLYQSGPASAGAQETPSASYEAMSSSDGALPTPKSSGAVVLDSALPALWDIVAADDVVPLPPVTGADGSMGTCFAFYEVELNGSYTSLAPYAYAAGSRWDRFDFRWNVIEGESSRKAMDFSGHDRIVDMNRANGINVVGILGSTPKWAAPGCHVLASEPTEVTGRPTTLYQQDPPYWWRPCPPDNLEDWRNYVYQTVDHFKGRVDVWEIWNEPDIQGVYWSGTEAQYAELLKVGYEAVKTANPEATVLFGGLAYWHDTTFYADVLDELIKLPGAAENNYYFDAMSLHLYNNVYHFDWVIGSIKQTIAAKVGPHPIWVTESGVPLWDEIDPAYQEANKPTRATAEEAAAFVIQGYAEARAAGVEKFFFFRTHDDGMGGTMDDNGTPVFIPYNFGLIRDDLSLRPAYVGYQVTASYLHGENQITGPFVSGTAQRITFWGTPRGRIDVLWNLAGGAPITYTSPAVVPTATVVNQRGETRFVQAANGVFTLSLDPATAHTALEAGNYIIGGPPLLLIQEDTQPPVSALRPLPGTTYTDTLTLTWDVSDDLSGHWYTEVERAPEPGGPWTRIASWQTAGATATVATLPEFGTWYFRARTRDNVGNWEAWPATPETSTFYAITRTVALSVTAYLDDNGNGLRDATETLTESTRLTWLNDVGTVMTETLGATWHVTQNVTVGTHRIRATLPDYLPASRTFLVEEGTGSQAVTLTLGLRAIKGRVYLPMVLR
jgi:hypothetical protein